MELTFLGAAGEVTGSCTRVRHDSGSFIVDCGLFQGGRDARLKNVRVPDFDPKSVDFVLLTHAHLDHSGLIPRLIAFGYKGPVYTTRATADLLGIMLLDSAHIQEKEAEWINRHQRGGRGRSDRDLAPLYTVEQARASLRHLQVLDYEQMLEPAPGVRCRFRDAGHILGSSFIEIDLNSNGHARRLVFSGDLGQPLRPVLCDPAPLARADILCIESTYGNRAHRPLHETMEELVEALQHTLFRRHGNVIIPAFAVGRTQEMLFVLAELVRSGRLPHLDIVVDSPMATAATALTLSHERLWDDETRALNAWARSNTHRFRVRFVQDVEESIALNACRGGLVIVSASGMCEAGRIKHHLRHNLGREECAIVIVGFQAAGTLGRRLVEGVRTVSLFGEHIPVRARVHTIGGLSAHADQPALLGWLRPVHPPPQRVFVMHGEKMVADAFAAAIHSVLGWKEPTVAQPARPYLLQ